MGYPPVPTQRGHICQYDAFLSRTLKATSIPNYLNIISILHKEFNLPNPLANNWVPHSLLTGIKRVKGQPPAQKLSIIPDILVSIYHKLNLHSSFDASFWAARMGCCAKAIFYLVLSVPLTPLSSLSGQIFTFSPGVPLSLFGGAKPFSSGSGGYTSRYPSYPIPLPAQSLLSEGLSLLFTMLLRTDRHSRGKILLSFVSRFLLIPSFCSAFVLSSRPLACRPRILFATLYRRVVHLLLLRQGYQLGLLRA